MFYLSVFTIFIILLCYNYYHKFIKFEILFSYYIYIDIYIYICVCVCVCENV